MEKKLIILFTFFIKLQEILNRTVIMISIDYDLVSMSIVFSNSAIYRCTAPISNLVNIIPETERTKKKISAYFNYFNLVFIYNIHIGTLLNLIHNYLLDNRRKLI